jgi:DNA polymerase III subunit gamma/tau
MTEPETPTAAGDYRVLARKYRPSSFAGLIGQQAMVRTLTNAIGSGRLAHAFILTGVRGVGKTTAARIIARVLNCAEGPTAEPCGQCEHCVAIAEDRHMDVIEMDAASRTKVEEMRELLDGVRYRPTSARYKIYIIDEVHMLSRHAFNALLKTLEEPPAHVKFVFATTEIRKVPVTVLSRCQRFDLRRVDAETLAAHFEGIAQKENARIDAAALHLIVRAADGSVRDGLSLLDQAIAHGGGEIDEDRVRAMLGLADRTVTFDLMDAVMRGDIAAALTLMADQYRAGAEPAAILEDMLELDHWLTRVKVVPEAAEAVGVPEAERVRGGIMAGKISMAALARAWQMLLKGLDEVRTAPSPLQAAEMVLVRLAYAADLPTPAEAVKAMTGTGSAPFAAPPSGGAPSPSAPVATATAVAAPVPAPVATPDPTSLAEVVELLGARREAMLRAQLVNDVHLVQFEPGRIELRLGAAAPAELPNRLSRFLNETTARRWMVTVSGEGGEATLHQQAEDAEAGARAAAEAHPLVRAVLDTFPGAAIAEVRAAAPEDTEFTGEPEGEETP